MPTFKWHGFFYNLPAGGGSGGTTGNNLSRISTVDKTSQYHQTLQSCSRTWYSLVMFGWSNIFSISISRWTFFRLASSSCVLSMIFIATWTISNNTNGKLSGTQHWCKFILTRLWSEINRIWCHWKCNVITNQGSFNWISHILDNKLERVSDSPILSVLSTMTSLRSWSYFLSTSIDKESNRRMLIFHPHSAIFIAADGGKNMTEDNTDINCWHKCH